MELPVAGTPVQHLPDVRHLPVSIQEYIWSLCDQQSQATLAHTSSCFRPLWHKQTTFTLEKGKTEQGTACGMWHERQMAESAERLLPRCIRAQMTRQKIQRAPCYHGNDTIHCSILGHLTQQQLGYILQLPLQSVRLLGRKLATCIFGNSDGSHAMEMQWPGLDWDVGPGEVMSESMFLSFELTCRRRAELTDDEIEHLEGMFSVLPPAFYTYTTGFDEARAACEPRWSCITTASPAILMHWDTAEIEHVADKYRFMV